LQQSAQLAFWYAAARIAGWLRPFATRRPAGPAAGPAAPAGISVVIPSRNGRSLLAAQLPGIVRDLASPHAETPAALARDPASPPAGVAPPASPAAARELAPLPVEVSPPPLPAAAVTQELPSTSTPTPSPAAALARQLPSLPAEPSPARTRESASLPTEVIVIDNGSTDGTATWLAAEWPGVEVEVSAEPLSFAAAVNRGISRARYSRICLLNNDMLLEPGFFAALDEAFQAVPSLFCATAQIRFPAGVRREETGKAVMAQAHPDDFPIRCDEPIPGEDLSYVLYGSGGCSLYDAAMLRALGGADEAYAPAYVEDLDLGYRAWQRGWPTVFVAGAVVEHRHRATTSRYYSEAQLAEILERNYLKFLARAVSHGPLYRRLWKQALGRLRRRKDRALRFAAALALAGRPSARPFCPEEEFLALTAGDVAIFPGRDVSREPLVMFADRLERPPDSVLEAHSEVVLVRQGERLALRAARRWTGLKRAQRTGY